MLNHHSPSRSTELGSVRCDRLPGTFRYTRNNAPFAAPVAVRLSTEPGSYFLFLVKWGCGVKLDDAVGMVLKHFPDPPRRLGTVWGRDNQLGITKNAMYRQSGIRPLNQRSAFSTRFCRRHGNWMPKGARDHSPSMDSLDTVVFRVTIQPTASLRKPWALQ